MHHFVLQASPKRNPWGRELVLAIDIFYILSGYPWPTIAGQVCVTAICRVCYFCYRVMIVAIDHLLKHILFQAVASRLLLFVYCVLFTCQSLIC
jgi:hypothetical protein